MKHFYQDWLNSYEEQSSDSTQIYRPHGYKEWSPSRFRMQYIFEQDGSCQWLVLDQTDAHYLAPGTWEVSKEDSRAIVLYDSAGVRQESISFRVIELKEDLMEITGIE